MATKKERTELQQFQVGDIVRVTTLIMSRQSNQVGTIVSVQLSRHARTLDKYVVMFSDNTSETFWDIQLEAVPFARSADASGPA